MQLCMPTYGSVEGDGGRKFGQPCFAIGQRRLPAQADRDQGRETWLDYRQANLVMTAKTCTLLCDLWFLLEASI